MRRLKTLIFLLPLLAGCAGHSGIHAGSKPVAVKAPELPLRENWWNLFGDDQLDGLIREALASSPDIRVARARIRRAGAAAGIARSAQFVQIAADASAVRERISGTGYFPPPLGGSTLNFAQATLGFDYEFDWWGKNREALKAAISETNAAIEEEREARLVLGTAIAGEYFRLQSDFEKIATLKKSLRQRRRMHELVSLRETKGLESDFRVKQYEGEEARAKLAVTELEEESRLIRAQIAALLGKPPEAGEKIEPRRDVPPVLPASIPADGIGLRPDILAQKLRLEASRHRVAVAKAEFYPNIDLSAFVGTQSIGFGNLLKGGSQINSFGPAIHLPIFGGGQLRSNLREKYAEYDIEVEQYNGMVIGAMRDVHAAKVSLDSASAEIAEQRKALSALKNAHRIAVARFQAGVGDELSVLETESPIHVEQNVGADLEEKRFQAVLSMIRSLGGAPGNQFGVKNGR